MKWALINFYLPTHLSDCWNQSFGIIFFPVSTHLTSAQMQENNINVLPDKKIMHNLNLNDSIKALPIYDPISLDIYSILIFQRSFVKWWHCQIFICAGSHHAMIMPPMINSYFDRWLLTFSRLSTFYATEFTLPILF